jgi:hypothetical protein
MRPSIATPEVFRLFGDILTILPPPPLVDGICLAIDCALRQPEVHSKFEHPQIPELLNSEYAAVVCTSSLAKALCDLLVLGTEYASSALFAALRYVVGGEEVRALFQADSAQLLRLSYADGLGIVRYAAQAVYGQQLLAQYSTLPFPKPDFPLSEQCMLPIPSPYRHLFCSSVRTRPSRNRR